MECCGAVESRCPPPRRRRRRLFRSGRRPQSLSHRRRPEGSAAHLRLSTFDWSSNETTVGECVRGHCRRRIISLGGTSLSQFGGPSPAKRNPICRLFGRSSDVHPRSHRVAGNFAFGINHATAARIVRGRWAVADWRFPRRDAADRLDAFTLVYDTSG